MRIRVLGYISIAFLAFIEGAVGVPADWGCGFSHKPLDAQVLSIVMPRALNWRLRERAGAMWLEGIVEVSDTMCSLCRGAKVPDTLLENELFGYATRTAGKLESADRGTVFLEEIGEMPAWLQAKLLRVGAAAGGPAAESAGG